MYLLCVVNVFFFGGWSKLGGVLGIINNFLLFVFKVGIELISFYV